MSKNKKKTFIIIAICAVVLIAIIAIGSNNQDTSKTATSGTSNKTVASSAVKDEKPKTTADTDSTDEKTEPTEEPTPNPSKKWYDEGMYIVGEDIPSGEYYIRCTSTFGSYFAISKDSTGTLDSIIANGNFDTFTYVKLKKGQYFEVSRGEFIKAKYAPKPESDNGVFGEGMYKVGRDIPEGEYKLSCVSEYPAYYAVTSDSTHVLESIVTNDNFNATKYVSLKKGQYIEVVRAEMKKR